VPSDPSSPTAARPIRRALFVDRDGTLNPDLHYLKDAERLELFRGVGDALALARDHGYLTVCVTNQSGVERGFYSADDVDRIHARLNELLAPHRARIDAFYYCPHAPDRGCACRKPGTGLFEDARRDWNIDFASSAVVGDRDLDIEAGRKLGLLTALVPPVGCGPTVVATAFGSTAPDIVAMTFADAVFRVLARG
jgi:D-glycero-D-manno-heptose 1,7-bisphosphate phosphatase